MDKPLWGVRERRPSNGDASALSICILILLFTGVITGPALSQSPNQAWKPFLAAEASVIPLHGGTASTGRYLGVGPSVRIGLNLGSTRLFSEASYTGTPADQITGRPAFRTITVLMGTWFSAEEARLQGWIGAGVGRLKVDAKEVSGCVPPCMNEGPNFQDATLTTAVGGIGASLRIIESLSLRGGLRFHVPLNGAESLGESRSSRLEIALGAMWRF
jgi:hypothetical protein